MKKTLLTALCLAFSFIAPAATVKLLPDGQSEAAGKNYRALFNLPKGAMSAIILNGKNIGVMGSHLWYAVFRDNHSLSSRSAKLVKQEVVKDALVASYTTSDADVTVKIVPGDIALDVSASITVKKGELLEFCAPGITEFEVKGKDGSFIFHQRGPANVGLKLKSPFFEKRPIWTTEPVGTSVYKELFGAMPYTPAEQKVCSASKGKDLFTFLTPAQYADVTRYKNLGCAGIYPYWPVKKGELELELLTDPANGDILWGGTRCGGKEGALLRLGGLVQGEMYVHILLPMYGVVAKNHVTRTRDRICLVAGIDSERTPFTESIGNWQKLFAEVGLTPELLKTPAAVAQAIRDPRTAVIINPYGEICMTPDGMSMADFGKEIRKFVKEGGLWMEINGRHSFSRRAFQKPGYLRLNFAHVPYSFADFFFINTGKGKFSFNSVQPFNYEPFSATKDGKNTYIASRSMLFANSIGGKLDRRFVTYVKAGQSWTTPVTRFHFNVDEGAAARAYLRDNGFDKTKMEQRYDAAFLKDFKRRMFILTGDFHHDTYQKDVYKMRVLPPCLFHVCFYNNGDFDHMYPDFLPPLPRWGTLENFKEMYRVAEENDQWVLPYTNNTMWCDKPRGPTFLAAGEEPLQLDLNGKKVWEVWTDWTTCTWHPAVRAANDKITDTFTKTYPTRILFQDQVAARGVFRNAADYDLNPAIPTPYARTEGFISQARRDNARRTKGTMALATEDMNAIFMSDFILGAGNNIAEAPLLEWFPPETWELYNVIGLLSHEHTEMFFHGEQLIDTDAKLAKALGLGFGMLSVLHSGHTGQELSYIQWLAQIQQRVVARHLGKPMRYFRHKWFEPGIMGVYYGGYGPVNITANLRKVPLRVDNGLILAADGGWLATTKDGLVAGNTVKVGAFSVKNGFIVDGDELVLMARPGAKAAFPLPAGGVKSVTCNGTHLPLEIKGNAALVTLPMLVHEAWNHPWQLKLVK